MCVPKQAQASQHTFFQYNFFSDLLPLKVSVLDDMSLL